MEIDVSELKAKSFECLDGCAMCCLCQPELSMDELAGFRKNGLTAGLTKNHIQGYRTDEPTAIKLQGGNGACHFLRDRRCTIHELRPAFCRQFPVHVHALHRIQLNANLSCRGITRGGDSLAQFGNSLVSDIDPGMMASILVETRDAVKSFEAEAAKAGVHRTPERLREAADGIIPVLCRPGGIGRVLAFADSDMPKGSMELSEILSQIEKAEPPEDLWEAAAKGNYEQLELENPAWRPVYVDAEFRWRSYHSTDGKIKVEGLGQDGTLTPELEIPLDEIPLLEPDEGAWLAFNDYADVLNSRDHFLGYSYWMCENHDYAHDLMAVYLGLLGTAMLDLWWRTGLVGRIQGRKRLDRDLALEGIRAFDMDCLDMPTKGVFF